MASMLGGMGDAMKEQAKKAVEDELANKAPGALKPLFPCCGGPVSTMETCICMVPADQQESVKAAIAKYKMASMLGGMGDAMKEQAKKAVEDELANKAPGALKPLFPCCGGPVSTMETCICMVPADQQESVKAAIQKYKGI
eukprot:Skav213229  [mRNA]  locus=scaffold5415:16675:17758:- [translate_table: standard]